MGGGTLGFPQFAIVCNVVMIRPHHAAIGSTMPVPLPIRRPGLRCLALAASLWLWLAPAHAAEDTVRAEVAKPLQAAQEALKAGQPADALARVREAEAVANRSEYEAYVIGRTKGAAALAAKDNAAAQTAFEALLASPRATPAEHTAALQALPGLALRNRQPAQAITWARRHLAEGGQDRSVRLVLVQALFNTGDCPGTLRELLPLVQADEAAGKKPGEDLLKLAGNCQLKTHDDAGYYQTLLRLVTHHAQPEYWADLLPRVQRQPGFAERLQLTSLRLMRQVGAMEDADDFMDMAQLALKAGLPGEAKAVLEAGFAKGALGKGPGAPQHQRLRDSASKQAADDAAQFAANEARARSAADGAPLFNLGLAMATAGQTERGLVLMQQGLAKGIARQPGDAKLNLGATLLVAGRRAEAEPLLRGLNPDDGSATLARLWLLAVR